MAEAIAEAERAFAEGEVPVGAVFAVGGRIIARDHNRIEQLTDASAHAEMLVLRAASQALENWRLGEGVLYVSLEPCTMCVGALKLARVKKVVYGAGDSRFGAAGSVHDLTKNNKIGPEMEVIGGVLGEKCSALLKRFFAERRHGCSIADKPPPKTL